MSIINIFTREPPRLGYEGSYVTFDAVFEDTFESTVTFTRYPIESGGRAADHGIINPRTYTIKGGVSNNPLSTSVLDFAGGFLSNFFDNAILSSIAGLSAGFLSGSDGTRAGSTLEFLLALMYARKPIDIDAGDILQLQNMCITAIRRTKTPENEGGLMFEADFQEVPTLLSVITQNYPKFEQLPKDDPAATQAAPPANKGEVIGIDVPDIGGILA